MKKDCNDDTFVKITNADIYAKLCTIEKHVMVTNGKIKFHTKAISVISGAIIIIVSWIFTLIKG